MTKIRIIVKNQYGTFHSSVQNVTDLELKNVHEFFEQDLAYFKMTDEEGDDVYFPGPVIMNSVITVRVLPDEDEEELLYRAGLKWSNP